MVKCLLHVTSEPQHPYEKVKHGGDIYNHIGGGGGKVDAWNSLVRQSSQFIVSSGCSKRLKVGSCKGRHLKSTSSLHVHTTHKVCKLSPTSDTPTHIKFTYTNKANKI